MFDNLLTNPDFVVAGEDGVPAGWYLWAPRPEISPRAMPLQDEREATGVALTGNGKLNCFGKLGQTVVAQPGQWYRVAVRFRAEGLDDLTRCALINLVWRREGSLVKEQPVDAIRREGEWLIAEKVYQCPPGADTADLEIFLRHATSGRLVIAGAELRETEARAPGRVAAVATCKVWPASPSTPESNRELFCEMLDRAGLAHADICCLPEATNKVAVPGVAQDVAEPLEGPSFAAYAARAREHGMWVVACYYTREGDTCHNTSVLIDRQGQLAGAYRKTHLHWPELRDGITPGDEYPVFATDFGTIGMMICYDSWFPEVARLLAYKGAEAIFFPVWGYDETTVRGRAVDNNVFIIAASLGSPGQIIGSNGDSIARTTADGVVTAEIAIEARPTYAYVDRETTNGIPGATRWTRDTVSLREYDELREEIVRLR